ncbi:MAG: galactokinase [Planctomycetes bacterium]|nr:galactokinase [Planctomycetota bacterium]MBU4398223.1 galactokinase [Planctomycetota bacterium]MCG2683941.1 galactokinase [Planctomycetales bacterium]
MPIGQAEISARFTDRFGHFPNWIVRAPGRVNLIGEHTDYNDGFVLPMAIDRAVWIALRPRDDRIVSVYSIDYDETGEFSLDALQRQQAGWIEYLKGTAWSLQEAGHRLTGWDGVLAGDVPLGAGLSSSAALEMAAARALAATGELPWEPAEMAKLGQRAENQWVGVNCGIMDQLISAAGRAGNALLIDCRSLQTEPVPLPRGTSVVVLDTSTRRGLVDSAYNERRRQCEEAARLLDVHALRDATIERLERSAGKMDPAVLRRARHVIAENDRTLLAADAMRRGDAVELGRLMHQSHRSLRDDYEVSSDALNAMVECASVHRSCFGARMTGAGFGGCAVALVRAEATDDFVRDTAAAYQRKTGHSPAVYVCQAADGAEVM